MKWRLDLDKNAKNVGTIDKNFQFPERAFAFKNKFFAPVNIFPLPTTYDTWTILCVL